MYYATLLLTFPDGTTYEPNEMATSYGDEPLTKALQQLNERGMNEVASHLQEQLRTRYGTGSQLNLTPETEWHADHPDGYSLVIRARF